MLQFKIPSGLCSLRHRTPLIVLASSGHAHRIQGAKLLILSWSWNGIRFGIQNLWDPHNETFSYKKQQDASFAHKQLWSEEHHSPLSCVLSLLWTFMTKSGLLIFLKLVCFIRNHLRPINSLCTHLETKRLLYFEVTFPWCKSVKCVGGSAFTGSALMWFWKHALP